MSAKVSGSGEAMLSIGALSRATGIPVPTLRTWEARYGVPTAVRRPSGHRLYPLPTVAHLRTVSSALSRGLRASEVLGASPAQLEALVAGTALEAVSTGFGGAEAAADLPELLTIVERMDAARLTRILLADAAWLGAVELMVQRVAPLLEAVGQAWATGTLEVRHEHFLSARVGDLLRALRLSAEERADGALVCLATLPGESHSLGLEMAALVLASASCRTLVLGTETPPREIVQAALQTHADAVAVSISVAARGAASARAVNRLRAALPSAVRLLLGGGGAPAARAGVETVAGLHALATWGRQLRRRH